LTVAVDLPVPTRALAVGAHPDDIEFGAGATLSKWAAHGCALLYVVCTDGSKGTWDPDADLARLVAVREDEQRAASIALGGTGDVEFLRWPDGELDSATTLRAPLVAAIRRFRPDVVLGHDPWKRYRLHPDHRHAGFLTIDAIVAARDPHFFPELGLAHHRPGAVLLFEADEPDHVERIDGFAERKIDALLAHRSQLRSTMDIDDPESAEQLDAFRGRILAELEAQGGLAGVAQGEAFKAITDV
jgi:LmbE family N-acetylglucosaminyl deacetylase